MALIKREYTDNETTITAKNMNDIQDAVIALEDGLFSVDNDKSGAVIAITDASTRGFRSLNIYGKTTQNGTPTLDSPASLVNVGKRGTIKTMVFGKNMIAPTEVIIDSNRGNIFCYRDSGMFLPIGTYTLQINTACTAVCVRPYGSDENLFIKYNTNTLTFTLAETTRVHFLFYSESKFAVGEENTIQLEIGTVATEFEMHNGKAITTRIPNGLPGIPVATGGNYTDASGQRWLCDEVDFARGVYVRRVEVLSLAVANMDNSENYPGWRNVGIAKYYPNCNGYIGNFGAVSMCNITANSKGAIYINTLSGNDVLLIPGYSGTTQTQWKTQYPNLVVEIVYSIPTPIETVLSDEERAAFAALHTYKDYTTITNDAGTWMDLEYVMDTKKYIDSLVVSGGGSIIPATVE